jgi:hypothetical protein
MAKKKKKEADMQAPITAWKPPTPQQRRRMAAEDAARIAVDTDPAERKERKQREDAITSAIMEVMSKRLD